MSWWHDDVVLDLDSAKETFERLKKHVVLKEPREWRQGKLEHFKHCVDVMGWIENLWPFKTRLIAVFDS